MKSLISILKADDWIITTQSIIINLFFISLAYFFLPKELFVILGLVYVGARIAGVFDLFEKDNKIRSEVYR